MAKLIEQLERKRAGYDAECIWHRFLMDGFLGTGGFAGKVRQPVSGPWGAAADMYSGFGVDASTVDTYLDAHPREEPAKFARRADQAEYHNYVKALTSLKLGHISRKEFIARDRPETVAEWRKNVDGNGTSWDELRPRIDAVTAVLGWRPVLIDARPTPTDEHGNPLITNAAQAREADLRPYPVPLFPANLLDYGLDDAGQFTYAKIRTQVVRQEAWDAEPEEVSVYTIWTLDSWVKYEVNKDREPAFVGEGPNPFDCVPLVIYQHEPAPQEPVIGLPMHGDVTQVARAHLNRLSELNEHLRGQVFALLVLSCKSGIPPADVSVGVDNALVVDSEARQTHAYIAPPGTVAATYKERLEDIVREMYRVARVEYTRSSGNASSGEAHAYEFAQTNQALADFAGQIAKAEMQIDWLVGRYYKVPEAKLRASTIIPPKTFDVENLIVDIKATFDLIAGDVGVTATKLLKMQALRQMLRNLDEDTVAIIDDELDATAKQKDVDDAAAEEAALALAEQRAQDALDAALQDDGTDGAGDNGSA